MRLSHCSSADIALDMRDNGGFEKIAESAQSADKQHTSCRRTRRPNTVQRKYSMPVLRRKHVQPDMPRKDTEHRRGDSALTARRRGCKHHVFAEKITVRSGNCRAIPLHRDGYTRDAYDTARYFFAMGISGRSHHKERQRDRL